MAEIKNQSDDNILVQGIGMPYLALFSELGTPVINPTTGVPLGAYIHQFQYKYDEEKPNECTITFDCDNPNIVDEHSFPKDTTLFIQWGYIYPDGSSISSEAKSLKVRDYNADFDDTGIHGTLVCVDSKADLVLSLPVRPNGDESKTLDKFLENGCGLNMPVIIEAF